MLITELDFLSQISTDIKGHLKSAIIYNVISYFRTEYIAQVNFSLQSEPLTDKSLYYGSYSDGQAHLTERMDMTINAYYHKPGLEQRDERLLHPLRLVRFYMQNLSLV